MTWLRPFRSVSDRPTYEQRSRRAVMASVNARAASNGIPGAVRTIRLNGRPPISIRWAREMSPEDCYCCRKIATPKSAGNPTNFSGVIRSKTPGLSP